uniref:Evasin n=1 Tax=Rhipicephalus appendiculatus TaxID=34631 RepID=A0A131Z694_RHIAP
MAVKVYVMVIAVVYVVQMLCGADEVLDDENTTEGDYSYEQEGCPFLVAENRTGFGTIVQCTHDCYGKNESVPEGTRCFTIGDEGLWRMKVNMSYYCPLGECRNGDCVPNGQREVCYRRNWGEKKNKTMK